MTHNFKIGDKVRIKATGETRTIANILYNICATNYDNPMIHLDIDNDLWFNCNQLEKVEGYND